MGRQRVRSPASRRIRNGGCKLARCRFDAVRCRIRESGLASAAHDESETLWSRRADGDPQMNYDVFITCAVTGAGDTVGRHPGVPVTPKQIAEACLEAASAGAAMVHIHVRDPKTGKGSRDPRLFREVVEQIRGRIGDTIINLTAGMG